MSWRSPDDDPPDWKDAPARVELKRHDGSVVSGFLDVDAWFNGQDEVPVFSLTLDDGQGALIDEFEGYRIIEHGRPGREF